MVALALSASSMRLMTFSPSPRMCRPGPLVSGGLALISGSGSGSGRRARVMPGRYPGLPPGTVRQLLTIGTWATTTVPPPHHAGSGTSGRAVAVGQGTASVFHWRDETAAGAAVSPMRSDIRPGGSFPDYALPDDTGTVGKGRGRRDRPAVVPRPV